MKPAFTGEQISKWFTSGTTLATLNLKDNTESSTPAEPSPVKPDDSSQKADVGRIQNPEPSRSPPPVSPCSSFECPSLPITKDKEQLISFIESNSVVIVRGATGSGKTTQLPQFILDHYNEKTASCNIVVTQPRKIGATSIARWVAAQRKCILGSLVGYQVGTPVK
ncbi:putative ATP-dependent RNA helicase TDRD9 [Poecilia latipinna]|nr:PREDICTED: putative ATP-dependent RNA helicase TDRD9 [Poecilia latipinna]